MFNNGKELHKVMTECSDVYHACDNVKIVFRPGKNKEEDLAIWEKVKLAAAKLCKK